jgi:hypothetical protein
VQSQGLDRLGTHAQARLGVLAPVRSSVMGGAVTGRRARFTGSESTGGNGATGPASGLRQRARLGLGPNQNREKKSFTEYKFI